MYHKNLIRQKIHKRVNKQITKQKTAHLVKLYTIENIMFFLHLFTYNYKSTVCLVYVYMTITCGFNINSKHYILL